MSFLKFTGNKRSSKSEDLDLPPLPPPLKGPEDKFDSIEDGPPLDGELPDMDKIDENEPTLPESPDSSSMEFPDAPPLPDEPTEDFPLGEDKEDSLQSEPFDTKESAPVPKAKEGPLFIKIDKYREVLTEINKIKADFEKSKNILSSIAEIKATEDKELESWKYSLEDIRKKLASMDKNIFEGG